MWYVLSICMPQICLSMRAYYMRAQFLRHPKTSPVLHMWIQKRKKLKTYYKLPLYTCIFHLRHWRLSLRTGKPACNSRGWDFCRPLSNGSLPTSMAAPVAQIRYSASSTVSSVRAMVQRLLEISKDAVTTSVHSWTFTKPLDSNPTNTSFNSGVMDPPSRTALLVATRCSKEDCSYSRRFTRRLVPIHGISKSYCFTRRSLRISNSKGPRGLSCAQRCAAVKPPPMMIPRPWSESICSGLSKRSQAWKILAKAAGSKLW